MLERWGQVIDRAIAGIADPGRAVRRGHADLRAAGLDPPGHRRVPHRHWPGRSGHPEAAWRRAPCATSRPARPWAGSPLPDSGSRSAPWPAACSGCGGCASGTPDASAEATVDQLAEAGLRLLGVPAQAKPPAWPLSRSLLRQKPGDKPRQCCLPRPGLKPRRGAGFFFGYAAVPRRGRSPVSGRGRWQIL